MRSFTDPVLELAARTDLAGVLDLAPTDQEARDVLEAMAEAEAEQRTGAILGRLRREGHLAGTISSRARRRGSPTPGTITGQIERLVQPKPGTITAQLLKQGYL
jgi:hypothetical protein